MALTNFSRDYRSDANQSKFPRLRLQSNERARGAIVSGAAMEYVHRLDAPRIVNMAPTYKKIKDKDGNDKYVVDTKFVAAPICQGDKDMLKERGVDDKGCEACLMSRDRPDIFRPPQPRFAVNFIRYNLRPGGSWNDIATPYGVSLVVWAFGPGVMDKLADIRSMGAAYDDIRNVDLFLTCEEQNYQKPYSSGEFLYAIPAVWCAREDTRNWTIEYLTHNAASEEDLTAAIGKTVSADWLSDDIRRVIEGWNVVRAYESRAGGMPQTGAPGFGAETVQQGLAGVAQQYGNPGTMAAPPPQAGAQQHGGIDFGLLGRQAAPNSVDYMAAAQQSAAQEQNPAAEAHRTATGQPMPEPQGWAVPPTTPAAPAPPNGAATLPASMPDFPTVSPTAPTVPAGAALVASEPMASPTVQTAAAPVPQAAPAPDPMAAASPPAASPSNWTAPPPPAPAQGMAGLGEFSPQTTTNPQPQPGPAPPPAAPAAEEVPPKGKWTFDDLRRMGQ